MKKSKSFENLNIKSNNSSDEIILEEFIKNINSHINFLRTSFPRFFENIFAKRFVSKITKTNINSNRQKTTILNLRDLFEERSIHQESLDDMRVQKFEEENKIYGALLVNPIYLYSTGKEYGPGEFEYFCRKERQIRKIFDIVGPKQTNVLLKNQIEIQKVLEEEGYMQLTSTEHNPKKLIELRKDYLKKDNKTSIHQYLYFDEFYLFVCNYIYAMGFFCSDEIFSYHWLGGDRFIRTVNQTDFFRKAFLVFSLYEKIIILSAEFGAEIFGHLKNPISPNGASINAYEFDFIDKILADKIRKEELFFRIRSLVDEKGRDSIIKNRFTKFMDGEESCILVPLKTLRHLYVACGMNNSFNFDRRVLSRGSSDGVLDNLLKKVLLWAEERFAKCMKFF